jgi:glycosyltransferase involved in cell wall biosynthesis
MTEPKRSMAIVRSCRPNLAEMAVYRAFAKSWNLTFFYAGISEQDCRAQLDHFGLQAMRLVRYRSVSELVPWNWVRRGLDYKVGVGSYMLDHLDDILEHDVINITDPIFGFTHQIQRAIRPHQKLVAVIWENMPGRYNRIWMAARRAGAVMKRADMIICITRAAQAAVELPRGFAGTVTQIYAGIDQPGSREAPSTASAAARRLASHAADAPPVILFVGRFQRSKGLHVLLAAVQILRDRMKQDVTLWVVGGGSPGPLETLVHSLGLSGCVKFWGALSNSDVREKMATADLYCQPSLITSNWMEQFGFALAEAMACGMPVVAFDSGSIREVAGEDAAYATVGDPESLAEAIAGFLRDPAQARVRGERLRQRAVREFEADRQGSKMLEAITGLVEGPGMVKQVECV